MSCQHIVIASIPTLILVLEVLCFVSSENKPYTDSVDFSKTVGASIIDLNSLLFNFIATDLNIHSSYSNYTAFSSQMLCHEHAETRQAFSELSTM